jgi:hypothetical protein
MTCLYDLWFNIVILQVPPDFHLDGTDTFIVEFVFIYFFMPIIDFSNEVSERRVDMTKKLYIVFGNKNQLL